VVEEPVTSAVTDTPASTSTEPTNPVTEEER
jgi:hypothetical protein